MSLGVALIRVTMVKMREIVHFFVTSKLNI